MNETPQNASGPQDAVARAEAMVGRVEAEVGPFVARLIGRAREELEDIWAEVEAVRRTRKGSRGEPGSQG